MMKTDGMQNQLSNQIAMQQAMQNMNFYGTNPSIYANQARINSENNLANGVQPSSNHNLNSTTFLEGSGASYKQFLKNNKGSNHQLNDSNQSPGSVPQPQHGINVSQFKNKKIIVKHANIVKKKRQIKIWTSEEDELLKKLCEQLPGKWNEIAAQIPGRNASQCSQRWRRILPTKVRKPWTQDEDNKVIELSEKYGKNWGMIAQHIEGKTGKQVRERYINKLDPTIKRTPWTEDEDQKILDMFLEQGPKWSAISNELVGRPENTVKNRFYSHISRIYLSDDNTYLSNKNSDNKQKVKDACSKLPRSSNKKSANKPVRSFNNPNNDAMEEDDYDDDNDEDDDDEDEEDEEEQEDDKNQQNNNTSNTSRINGAAINANSNISAIGQEALQKKKNQQRTSQSGSNQTNTLSNNDRKNLKIEEQEDQDEELMERNPNAEEDDTNNSKNKGNDNYQQNKILEEGKNNIINRGLLLNNINTGLNQLSANNLDASGEKSPQMNMMGNSILAKRGKMIKNLEIPKGNSNQPAGTNQANQGILTGNVQQNNENENNAITGMGMISANNLDFLNTQTPQYYQNLGLFTNSQLTPLYPTPGLHAHNFQQLTNQHMNQPSSANQHETTSPMFVLGGGLNSPAPRSALPLFKPPMSGIGNTTPSAITPLLNNQYLVYAPQSLGMLTPGPFPSYNPIMNNYYMQQKGFPSMSKIGGGTLNDIDKQQGDNTDNNTFLNLLTHQNNNGFQNFDNTGIQSLTNFNFAPPTPGIAPPSFLTNNNRTNLNGNINTQQTQSINPNDLISYPAQDSNNNKNGGSNVSISVPQSEQKKEEKQSEMKQESQNGDKFQLENLLKEFSNLDPETRKRFQMMIGTQNGSANNNDSKNIKEEHQIKSLQTQQ